MKTINYDLLKIKNTSTGKFEPLGMALGLAVRKGIITKAQFQDIVGTEYN